MLHNEKVRNLYKSSVNCYSIHINEVMLRWTSRFEGIIRNANKIFTGKLLVRKPATFNDRTGDSRMILKWNVAEVSCKDMNELKWLLIVFNICLGSADHFNLRVLIPEKFINLIVWFSFPISKYLLWWWRQYVHLKRRCTSTTLHGNIS
jgi:hypothetical protein